jgi:cytosine/adenosine deaminase-related metal-dependent hydrolase
MEIEEAGRLGLLCERLLAVHVVGADAGGIQLLLRHRVVVVWCPTSNEWLLGRTAPSDLLGAARVVLGSDSLLTADGTLLDEIRAARARGVLSDDRLLDGVGRSAAEALAVPHPRIAPGARADFVVFAQPVLEATAADVELVVIAGVPRLASPHYATLFERAGGPYESLTVHRTSKLVCAPLASIASRIVDEWPECARIFAAR